MRLLQSILADGLRGLLRGRGLTAAAVLVVALTFSISSLALLLAENLNAAVGTWAQPDLLRVYMKPDADPVDMARRLQRRPGVTGVSIVGPEEARERFTEAFPELADVAGMFAESPFAPMLEVKLVDDDLELRSGLRAHLEADDQVEAVLSDESWAARLERAASTLRQAGQAGGLIFGLLAALVVAGVVRLSMAARREEMGTMSIVGAPPLFMAGPFLVEGLLVSGIGASLAVLAAVAVSRFARNMAASEPLAAFLSLAPLPMGAALTMLGVACAAGLSGAAWAVLRGGGPRGARG